MTIRGPKTTLYLWRYTATTDGGGSFTKAWTRIGTLKGVLTLIWPDERVRADKETLENRYQFWMQYRRDLDMTTKDELTSIKTEPGSVSPHQRYRVVFVDNILEQNRLFKINLVQSR